MDLPEPGGLTCARIEGLLAARALGAISDAAEMGLARHLESCASCAQLERELDDAAVAAMAEPQTDLVELVEVAAEHYVRGGEIGRGGMGRG
jgi:hypothetical protein